MDVFLFPLVNVTLFPKTTKPLNVFEPRYIQMVRDAITTKTPVALGFIEDPAQISNLSPGEKVPYVRDVVGYGQVQIIEERSNGTLLVFLQGEGKARLGAVKSSSNPYLICEAQAIEEIVTIQSGREHQIAVLNKILARWIHTHIPDHIQREVFMKNMNGPQEIVGAFSSYLIRDYDLQQMVLEFDDINDKVNFLYRLFESNEITA